MAKSNHKSLKKELQSTETPKIKKSIATLTNERYNTPRTSPLVFQFVAYPFQSADLRMKDCSLKKASVEGKDIYIFDDLFLESEAEELRDFSSKGVFSRSIFADHESREKGEEPARAMDNKEKWKFFSNPPQAVKEVYKLLSLFAERMNADITTLPWELYDQNICAPAVATNWIEKVSAESMDLGKHEDYNTEEGIAFGIPILYSKEASFYPNTFVNGDPGKPWFISLMLYATAENFSPEYGMGTIFYTKDEKASIRADCQNMRLILFEGDIVHGIEKSSLPSDVKTWRVSYVFKLLVNPKVQNQSMKKVFSDVITSYKGNLS